MDVITAAVQRGVTGRLPAPHAVQAGIAAYVRHEVGGAHADGLRALLELVQQCPSSERLQVLSARLLDRLAGRATAIEAWSGVRERFPLCQEAVLVTLRWTRRTSGPDAARAMLGSILPKPRCEASLLLHARALAEVGDLARASRRFAALSRRYPASDAARVSHVLMVWPVDPWRAARIAASGLRPAQPNSRLAALSAELDTDLQNLVPVPGLRRPGRAGVPGLVLAHLVREAGAGRREPARTGVVGPITMVGATLGAGGAERQLANTAIGLHRAHMEGRLVAGRALAGPVQVCCRSLSDRPQGDFFLPLLQAHSIPVGEYAALPEYGGDEAGSAAQPCGALLRFLPPATVAATVRLADELRRAAPAVVHIWQDGAILACALAALLAKAPRIVLGVRTAPPPDRPERDRPEYASLYPALLRLPGVTLIANSRFAAARYADWIGVDPAHVGVVPNGLAPPRRAGEPASRAMFGSFQVSAGQGFTVGTVMRLDRNKRPELWVDCAARLAILVPQARFIVVGDGPLRSEMESRSVSLGLERRFLFVGRTVDVGYWLSKMDAFLLLSRCEGLPNVLIEAQSMGVPVVATPAGGTAETLLDGRTGYLLASAETPCVAEAAGRLACLAGNAAMRRAMAVQARRFARRAFSLDAMIRRTAGAYDA